MRRDEAGSATVLGVQLVAMLAVAAMAAAAAVAYVVAHRRAQAGADLAALAGASAIQQGQDGCAVAAEIAAANHTRLDACAVADPVVTVTVSAATGPVLGRIRWAPARARAGPVSLTPDDAGRLGARPAGAGPAG